MRKLHDQSLVKLQRLELTVEEHKFLGMTYDKKKLNSHKETYNKM